MFGNRIAHTQSTGGKRLGLIYVSGDGEGRKKASIQINLCCADNKSSGYGCFIYAPAGRNCYIPYAGQRIWTPSYFGNYAIIDVIPFTDDEYFEINGRKIMMKDLFVGATSSNKYKIETIEGKLSFRYGNAEYEFDVKAHLITAKISDLIGTGDTKTLPVDINLSFKIPVYDGYNDLNLFSKCFYLSSAGLDTYIQQGSLSDAVPEMGTISEEASIYLTTENENFIGIHFMKDLEIATNGFNFKVYDIHGYQHLIPTVTVKPLIGNYGNMGNAPLHILKRNPESGEAVAVAHNGGSLSANERLSFNTYYNYISRSGDYEDGIYVDLHNMSDPNHISTTTYKTNIPPESVVSELAGYAYDISYFDFRYKIVGSQYIPNNALFNLVRNAGNFVSSFDEQTVTNMRFSNPLYTP